MRRATIATVLLAGAATLATPAPASAQSVEDIVERIARASERILDRAARAAGRLSRRLSDDEGDGSAQEIQFEWSERIAAGRTVEIKGVNGEVVAVPSTSGRVEVTAVKRGRRSDPGEVRIEVLEHRDGVTVCAVYPTPDRRRENFCGAGEDGRSSVQDNDVRVDFRVAVPADVRFHGRTVNGSVSVGALEGDVEASTVNGDVEVVTRGFAEISTVNGSIHAALGRAPRERASFKTVNGSIVLDLPDDVDADIDARWVNGGLESDLPFRLEGRTSRRRAQGSLGDGGPLLSLATVNGSIRIR